MADQPFPTWLYRHHKGGEYVFLLTGKDKDTQADLAIYRSKDTQQVWVRPLAEFCEPRFVRFFPLPAPDQEWERFFPVTQQLPRSNRDTVMAKLASGVKVAAIYDAETNNWRCATWESKDFRINQMLPDVIEWRYPAGK